MAKRVTTTTIEDEGEGHIDAGDAGELLPGGAGPVVLTDDGEANPVDELKAIAADDGVRWAVTKLAGRPGDKGGFCAYYSSGDLSLEVIRDQWGPGKYKIKGTQPNGRFVGQRTIEIASPAKAADAPALAAPLQSPGVDIAGLAQIMQSGSDRTMQLMAQMMAGQTQMLSAMLSRPTPAAPAGPSVMEILAMIKGLQPDKSEAGELVKMLLQGIELGKQVAGDGGGDETSLLGLGGKALDMLGPLIKQGAQPAPAPQTPNAPALAAPAPAAPAATANPAPTAPKDEASMLVLKKLQWVKGAVNNLVLQAARNKNASLYAEVFLDNLPEFVTFEEISERFNAADAVAQLAQIDVRVKQYAPWFENFRQEVLALLADDEPDADEGEAPGGES